MVSLLRFHLYAASSYVQGKPVDMGFVLENLSSDELWVLGWYTPLEGIKAEILEVTCDGVRVQYGGRLVKRGHPARSDYVHLLPHEAARAEFDLSSAYALPACRKCSVRFKGLIYDVVVSGQDVPRPADEYFAVEVPGGAVTFSIASG